MRGIDRQASGRLHAPRECLKQLHEQIQEFDLQGFDTEGDSSEIEEEDEDEGSLQRAAEFDLAGFEAEIEAYGLDQ